MKIIIVFTINLLNLLFILSSSHAYQGTTHKNITEVAINFLINDKKLPTCATSVRNQITNGSVEEDNGTRALNHFMPRILYQCDALSWASGSCGNNTFTWLTANSTNNVGKDTGWISLGHVVHLLEDMAVPAHVRQDKHPPGDPDPYELTTENFTVASPTDIISISSLNEAMIQLQTFTRKNFFSDDTIFEDIDGPKAVTEDTNYFYDESKNPIANKTYSYEITKNRTYCTINEVVALNQWKRLSPLVTKYAASLIYNYYNYNKNNISFSFIKNGSFETGDFLEWKTGNTYGCDFPQYACTNGNYQFVTSDIKTDGNFSARLGKWTQTYDGGFHGPPIIGAEPCGYNYMYQEIQMPDNADNLSLTFDYNVHEYDTAAWSWFDVFIFDQNGNKISVIIDKFGKGGIDYGSFWASGWKTMTYSLKNYSGQKISLWFGVRQDGYGDQISAWVDNINIKCQ